MQSPSVAPGGIAAPHSGHSLCTDIVVIVQKEILLNLTGTRTRSTARQHGLQMADFLFHFLRLADSMRNFFTQQFSIPPAQAMHRDRKSTRLNSSHSQISYA